jgi:preprotein translocase subunit YajC
LLDFSLVGDGLPSLWAQAANGANDPLGGIMFPMLIVATGLMFYFLLMRPEQRKRKEMEKRVSEIKKNDHVVTIGGIAGTVVAADPQSKFLTVRVDDSTGTKLRVLRSAISTVGAVEETEQPAKAS